MWKVLNSSYFKVGDPGARKELPETEPLWYMAQIPEHRHLMSHPTVTSFLWMKWRKIRRFFFFNLAFYLLFMGVMTAYVLQVNMNSNVSPKCNSSKPIEPLPEHEAESWKENPASTQKMDLVATHLYWIALLLLIVLTLRELFQMALSYRRYIFNLENLVEVGLIGLSFGLLLGPSEPGCVAHRHLSGIVVLLSWGEGLLLMGGHPLLSTYITMFREVSYNFSKFLVWFLMLIIAFGLCFFIIFQRHGEKDDDGEEVNAHFVSPQMSLMKTIIISLTGEIEFEGIDFSSEYSRIIFLVYVFFIMLVLVNLLNGLAVSDIAAIQKQSEIMSHISR